MYTHEIVLGHLGAMSIARVMHACGEKSSNLPVAKIARLLLNLKQNVTSVAGPTICRPDLR